MVERIKELCRKKNMYISQLEQALNFANGSIAKSKAEKIQASRVLALAQYFNVSMEYLMTGCEKSQNNDFTILEKEIIAAFRQADLVDQNSVLRILGLEKKEASSESKIS